MIRLFEAFSGYGSQSLEMKYLGIPFEHVGISEIDKYAIQAHEILHGSVKNYGDVSKIDAADLPDMDAFTYSFPCQDISNAGKQRGLEKGSGTRSSLLWECEKIIVAKRPMFLMMENVKNLVGKKNKPHFDAWLKVLENLGYNNYWKIINGKWCGVPQNRERVFCVSIRKDVDNGMFSFYKDFDNGIRLKDILEPVVDEKYYLSDEMTKGLIERVTDDGRYIGYINQNTQASKVIDVNDQMQTICAGTHGYANGYVKINDVQGCAIRGRNPDNPKSRQSGLPTVQMLEINKSPGISNCLTTVQKDSMILENELIQSYDLNHYNNDQMNRVYSDKGISPTILVVSGGGREVKISTDYRITKLTPYECLILMGVSHEDAMKLVNSGISNTQLYKMAGNSIITNCMRFLLKIYAIYILNEDKPMGQLSLF